ncbi:alpha/beta hydrolase [Nostoc sp. CHAB 5824]|nr:alpha/beta hydrolase [Nostoc sp. CHAB 5824]
MISQANSQAVKVLEVADDPRQVLVNAQASVKVDLSGIDEFEKTITADGYPITLNIVRPEGVQGILPVFMFIHGGGWVLGDYPTHKRMVHDLVVLSGFAAVFVNYTRTPDAQYPQAVNEVYAATHLVAEHGEEINVDGKNLAVVGNSVGGNMTAVTTLMAKAKGGPHIKLQILMWPFMRRRIASINDLPIQESDSPKETLRERKYHWILGRRPDDHPGLSDLNL